MSIVTILLIEESSINLRYITQLYTDRSDDYVYYACIFRVDHDDDDDNDNKTIDLTKTRNRPISLILVYTFNWIENQINDILTIYMYIAIHIVLIALILIVNEEPIMQLL